MIFLNVLEIYWYGYKEINGDSIYSVFLLIARFVKH